MVRDTDELIKVGLTLGDPNGVGPELILRTLHQIKWPSLCIPVIYGHPDIFSFYLSELNLSSLSFHEIATPKEAQAKRINIIPCFQDYNLQVGLATSSSGKKAFQALKKATTDLLNGLDALVTAPLNKQTLQHTHPGFVGHTEYLAEAFQAQTLMLMVDKSLRVGLVTGHLPLKEVPSKLNRTLIQQKLLLLVTSLQQDFGITHPKIAVTSLNPHAGDGGLLGKEELTLIQPVIEAVKKENIDVSGPFSTDGFFGSGQYKNYDGILGMYHDQVLAPYKTLSHMQGVNFTAGLPKVRTSPDHGPAYTLAGKGKADIRSYTNSFKLALNLTHRQKTNKVTSS